MLNCMSAVCSYQIKTSLQIRRKSDVFEELQFLWADVILPQTLYTHTSLMHTHSLSLTLTLTLFILIIHIHAVHTLTYAHHHRSLLAHNTDTHTTHHSHHTHDAQHTHITHNTHTSHTTHTQRIRFAHGADKTNHSSGAGGHITFVDQRKQYIRFSTILSYIGVSAAIIVVIVAFRYWRQR